MAFDTQVNLFFTFWGLNILKKKKGRKPEGSGSFMQRMFNIMMGGRNNLPLSKLKFCGIRPELMKGIMKSKNIKDVDGMLQDAIGLGAKIYACDMAMTVMGVKREDLISEITDVVGVGTFIANAEGGQVLFI